MIRLTVMSDDRRCMLTRIISGGQTGVDRGALDAAMALGLEHGGWCPRGRRAEDGPIPPQYRMREMDSVEYQDRTRQNVVDSDATLIIHRGVIEGGTALTLRFARGRRSVLVIDVSQSTDLEALRRWLVEHGVATLNVAGPRESSCPGIQQQTRELLEAALGGCGHSADG